MIPIKPRANLPGDLFKKVYLYACPKCHSYSPYADTLEEAYAAAMRRPLQNPMTLEELDAATANEEPVFFEFNGFRVDRFCDVEEDKWGLPFGFGQDDSGCVMVAISQCLYDPLALPKSRYNKTWRPWRTRPTDEERAAAEWEE